MKKRNKYPIFGDEIIASFYDSVVEYTLYVDCSPESRQAATRLCAAGVPFSAIRARPKGLENIAGPILEERTDQGTNFYPGKGANDVDEIEAFLKQFSVAQDIAFCLKLERARNRWVAKRAVNRTNDG